MDFLELKRLFAKALLKEPGNPFNAALSVFGDDIGAACMYAKDWNNDPFVLEELERLKGNTDLSELIPSKVEAASLAWDIANNCFHKGKERVDALRLFSEIAGYMPDKTVNKNIKSEATVNKVMVIKDHGTDEEWEEKVQSQQKNLTNA